MPGFSGGLEKLFSVKPAPGFSPSAKHLRTNQSHIQLRVDVLQIYKSPIFCPRCFVDLFAVAVLRGVTFCISFSFSLNKVNVSEQEGRR